MKRRRWLRRDRGASGYLESVFAIMVISSAITLLLASCSTVNQSDDRGRFLEREAVQWKQRLIGLLSMDGTTIEKKDLCRLADVSWELESISGLRVEIRVVGMGRSPLPLLELGQAAGIVDECYSLMVPINFIDSGPDVMAAKLVIVVW